MTAIELICRGLLVVVMATAVATKLGRGALVELTRTMAGFGLPQHRPLAIAVVAAEAASVVALVIAPTFGFAAVAALIAAFSLGIARAIREDARVSCRCFGSATTPVSASHLVRNALLFATAIAGAAACWGGGGDGGWAWPIIGGVVGVAITSWDEIAFAVAPSRSAAARRR
jgi:uncharacterized membrane protein YphA (DoxX/SURF4 family)